MNALVEAVEVGVRLQDKALIENISLRIAPGSAVAMIGPNGAGKSTLLRVISGDRAPRSGVAAFDRHFINNPFSVAEFFRDE